MNPLRVLLFCGSLALLLASVWIFRASVELQVPALGFLSMLAGINGAVVLLGIIYQWFEDRKNV